MNKFRIALGLFLGSGFFLWGDPINLPLEYWQNLTPNNYQSLRGVPLSTTADTPVGSDGRSPTSAAQSAAGLTLLPPTAKQFQGLISFGGVPGLTSADWQKVKDSTILKEGVTTFGGTVALEMKLPVTKKASEVIMIWHRTQIGAPYQSRVASMAFGSTIPIPDTDEKGVLLGNQVKESYWRAEPYTADNHIAASYYWSPNAKQVFAVQSGPMPVTWVKLTPYLTSGRPAYTDPGGTAGSLNYLVDGAYSYQLYTVRHIVSGTAIKTPRKMYWTEGALGSLGKPVVVPLGRVGDVAVVYNKNFPRNVSTEYKSPGQTQLGEGTTNNVFQELRTLWFDPIQRNILAHNQEGRAFLELLGDSRSDGTRQHLGFEIVDVSRQPIPSDVTIDLGERLTPPPPGSVDSLFPDPIQQTGQGGFSHRHLVAGTDKVEYYATRETSNLNDYQVHWLESGSQGLKWPSLFARYKFIWPTDAARYSHYVRPPTLSEADAKETAVPLDAQTVPAIEYQDPFNSVRAKLTEEFKFYTWLDAEHPAHRTLLRFSVGEHIAFERVFSWLDSTLKAKSFGGTVGTNLTTVASYLESPSDRTPWPSGLVAPRVVEQTVDVGQRLSAPTGEMGAVSDYVAGHLNLAVGTSYHPVAYMDPFASGFEAANKGAIIPVNAIPGANQLEVWWFRTNTSSAGLNAGNGARGFKSIYWPSVIGRYTVQYPTTPREIVLASKLGSGTLDPLEALGTIYYENDRTKHGYNPNEEHAIMSGGTAFATRDDLNLTTGSGYSSHPFVLVDYKGSDGRPALAVFKVLREKPEAGYVFDYIVEAGRPLQPPPPLTFLAKPVTGAGDTAVNYNTEPTGGDGDLPVGWVTGDATSSLSHYQKFTYRDRKQDFWVYRGLHAGLPALEAGRYDSGSGAFSGLSAATAIVGQPFSLCVHASRQDEFLTLTASGLPAGISIQGLKLVGTPSVAASATTLELVIEDRYDHTRVTKSLSLQVLESGTAVSQAALAISSVNSYTGTTTTFSDRPPFLAKSPVPANSFTMRYYYKTEPSFAWPGMTAPAAGTIVPYLRKWDSATSTFVGDAKGTTNALQIVYRPVWPVRDPKDSSKALATLPFGATLTTPRFGLPGVRDFVTAEILYQQSIAAGFTTKLVSAVLHDPTREKYADIKVLENLERLPRGIKKDSYQGKDYFPNLPPHLATRIFFDPNRGTKGSIVLKGDFKDELLGEKYIHLNVLRGSDLAAVHALCPDGDNDKSKWTLIINGLRTSVETFYENPAQPGTFIPNPGLTRPVGVQDLTEITSAQQAVDSYAISATGPSGGYITVLESSGSAFTQPGDPVSMHIFKVGGASLYTGELKIIPAGNPLSELVTFQHSADLAGRFSEYEYEWKIAAPVDGLPPLIDAEMTRYLALTAVATDLPRYTLGGAGIRALSDNYVVMRYRAKNTSHPLKEQWSAWTEPALAEGWIKRVLAGINPFNQRVGDLFNNRVNTDVSILTQAGHRWEGDVALNMDTINKYGLIEIYETVLRRGRMLSIESGYNYGPANDALLLAVGYLNDLYMMAGNEGWADAANPTIGIGTKDQTHGSIATALFAFKGQTASLLEEELALLRGRDDFLLPGVQTSPIYNRLVWNYTRGIDAGEVIYALNYNIQENPDETADGIINAADAAKMFPQGHGDAYGHYLTALKGYYSLLLNSKFDWVPRIEAVTVLGKAVSVDYQDERKFATAAAAVARAGRQAFDLTWRKDYQASGTGGWEHFGETRRNTQRSLPSTRHWGMDHWATRTGQGAYVNWVVGNAILPAVDPNPDHEGIQKVDRTTVPELKELAVLEEGLQTALDNAEGGLSPLGLPLNGLAFDINPNAVVGTDNQTHFEQVYQRAKVALNNAVAAFDDAKDVTRLLRSEQDSLVDFQTTVAKQELAYNNALIELYGTPYSDDIGAGKTFKQGFDGPDLLHYMYVETPATGTNVNWLPNSRNTFKLDIQGFPSDWGTQLQTNNFVVSPGDTANYKKGIHYIEYEWGSHGFFSRPGAWTGSRKSPGRVQQSISETIAAHDNLYTMLITMDDANVALSKSVQLLNAHGEMLKDIQKREAAIKGLNISGLSIEIASQILSKVFADRGENAFLLATSAAEGLPSSFIAGLAAGGDVTSPARMAVMAAGYTTKEVFDNADLANQMVSLVLQKSFEIAKVALNDEIVELGRAEELKQAVVDLGSQLDTLGDYFAPLNAAIRKLDDAKRKYAADVAEGDRIQAEREVFRQRTAAVVQGYRTRDAGFRIFRNEKLERYKTLFDLSARYSLLAANAYDYETGLLNTTEGRSFVQRLIQSRSLGVVRDGEPQFAGSNTGDPGLSSTLAEMKADWDVLKGRLGFNNPDAYGTTASLRTEALRILPGTEGDTNWEDILQQAKVSDLLADPDVSRHCMQINKGDGLPVPGLVLSFSTTIEDGYNLFGHRLAAGDHAFSPSSFATKIFGLGIALEGYRGMDNPAPNSGAIGGAGGTSPTDPNVWYLDPQALSANPYVYLIPVGVDSMRSPPLGDASTIRTWNVDDVAIPMPFNIGASGFSTQQLWQSGDSLTEPLFATRKHQAFRPVSTTAVFNPSLYGSGGTLQRSQYTNNRLVGRSAWNSQWKLVIPGRTLLNDPKEGLERFIKTVKDVKLHFVTYSYSGN